MSVQDICRLESHVLHIPTCPAFAVLRDGMGKLPAYNGPGKYSWKKLRAVFKLHSKRTHLKL